MHVQLEEARGIRRASASIRDGGIIHVKIPRHWSRALKKEVIDELVGRLRQKDLKERKLLLKAAKQPRITLATQAELAAYVRQVNAETFNVPLGPVKIGTSKYNHLAQLNLKTKVMTVSKYCIHDAPAEALRYLIIHELAHYYEGGHDAKFWALVSRHSPDCRLQSRIMKAFHHQTIINHGQSPLTDPAYMARPIASAVLPPSARQAPDRPKAEPEKVAALPLASEAGIPDDSQPLEIRRVAGRQDATPIATRKNPGAKKEPGPRNGLVAGLFKQLFLFGD